MKHSGLWALLLAVGTTVFAATPQSVSATPHVQIPDGGGSLHVHADGPGVAFIDLTSEVVVDYSTSIPRLAVQSEAEDLLLVLMSLSDPERVVVWTWFKPSCWANDGVMLALGANPAGCGDESGDMRSTFSLVERPPPIGWGWRLPAGRYMVVVAVETDRHADIVLPIGDGMAGAELTDVPTGAAPDVEFLTMRVEGRRFVDVPESVSETVTVGGREQSSVFAFGRLDKSHRFSTSFDQEWSTEACFGPASQQPAPACVAYSGDVAHPSMSNATFFLAWCLRPSSWCESDVETTLRVEQPSIYERTLVSLVRIPWGVLAGSAN